MSLSSGLFLIGILVFWAYVRDPELVEAEEGERTRD